MNADTQVSQDGPEDGTCLNGLWHNPKGALFHRLQNLRIYEAGIQDTREPVSFAPFTGTLKPWTSFNSELSDFITSAPIVGAFERTQAKPIGMNPAEMIKLNRNHVCFENITTGSEASMKGRFDHKVLGSTVLPSLLTMLDSQTDAGEEFTVDGIRMPSSFCFGTHKKLEHLGPHHVMWSPSCMLPAGDKIKNVKLVGLYLAANNYKLSIDSNAISFKGCRAADCLGKSTTIATLLGPTNLLSRYAIRSHEHHERQIRLPHDLHANRLLQAGRA